MLSAVQRLRRQGRSLFCRRSFLSKGRRLKTSFVYGFASILVTSLLVAGCGKSTAENYCAKRQQCGVKEAEDQCVAEFNKVLDPLASQPSCKPYIDSHEALYNCVAALSCDELAMASTKWPPPQCQKQFDDENAAAMAAAMANPPCKGGGSSSSDPSGSTSSSTTGAGGDSTSSSTAGAGGGMM